MIKYLELLLDLLRTSNEEDYQDLKGLYLAAGKKIEERGEKDLKIFHKFGFVFSAYEDLWTDKISLDEFLAIGDVTSNKVLVNEEKSSLDFLNSVIDKSENKVKDSLIILDSLSFSILSDFDKNLVQKWTKENNNELVLC